jgi:prephenate dehydratase
MKIGYLGPTGSFSESAAQEFFAGQSYEYVTYDSLEQLQEAFFKKEIDIIVMPIFNSKEGVLKSAAKNREFMGIFYDEICKNTPCNIVGEKFFEMKFCLLAKAGVKKENILHINVNPYGEGLCKSYLLKHPQWQIIKFPSTSAAARDLLTQDNSYAALAPKIAAEIYGLQILEDEILSQHDIPIMNFLVLSNQADLVLSTTEDKHRITVYLVQTDTPTDYLANLVKANMPLLNAYVFDGNKLYFEVDGVLSLEAERLLLTARKMGSFTGCSLRQIHQETMLTEEFKNAKWVVVP